MDVQNRVDRASPRLPAQVNRTGVDGEQGVHRPPAGRGPVLARRARCDELFLSNYADMNMRDAMKRIRGVGDVRIFGEREFSMRLWLDPTELARRRLTARTWSRALREQNLQVAAGQIGQPRAPKNQPFQYAVARARPARHRRSSRTSSSSAKPDGRIVRVRDVGRVELGARELRPATALRTAGRASVGHLPASRRNALDVRDGVRAEMERLGPRFPPGIAYTTALRHHARRARLDQGGA